MLFGKGGLGTRVLGGRSCRFHGVRVHVRLPCVSAGCRERGGGRLRGSVRVRLRLLTIDAAEEDVVGANEGGFVGFSAVDVAEGAVTCHQWSVG